MGERLVINIKYNNKKLANAYYHWSGYTDSSVTLINKLVKTYNSYHKNFINTTSSLERQKLLAIDLLQATGASFIGDRNDGLIAIEDNDMEYLESGGEHIVDINLDDLTINKLQDIMVVELQQDYEDAIEDGTLESDALDSMEEIITQLPDIFNIRFKDWDTWYVDVYEKLVENSGNYLKYSEYVVALF